MKQFLKIFLFLPLFIVADEKGFDEQQTALTPKEQSVILISAFSANGNMDKLQPAITKGLEAGLSVNEIKEIMVHLYAYTGFPRSLNALSLLMKTLDERKKAGITDTMGKDASPLPENFDRDAYGAKIRAMLSGLEKDISGAPWQQFSPTIDQYLKEHLFADIFARDILDYKTRELVTVSALAAMSGTQGQLKFHLGAAMNVGVKADQLKGFVAVLNANVDHAQAQIAKQVLDDVLKSRK